MPFSRRDKQRIARVTSDAEKRLMSSGVRTRNRPQTNYASYIVKTPSGGIPARSGTTLGSATCTVQDVATATISDGISVTVLNLSDTAIAGSTYVMATRDRQGNYIAENSGSTSFDICQLSYSGNSYATTTWTRQQIDSFAVTNATSGNTDSAIYENQTTGATSGNIKINSGGTYEVFFPFHITSAQPTNSTAYSFLDQISSLNTTWTYYTGAETFSLELFVTEEANTTLPSSSSRVCRFRTKAQNEGFAASIGAAPTGEQDISMGCIFSVDDSDAPFELQLWTHSSTQASASGNTITQLNDGFIIRYPDELAVQTTPYAAP